MQGPQPMFQKCNCTDLPRVSSRRIGSLFSQRAALSGGAGFCFNSSRNAFFALAAASRTGICSSDSPAVYWIPRTESSTR